MKHFKLFVLLFTCLTSIVGCIEKNNSYSSGNYGLENNLIYSSNTTRIDQVLYKCIHQYIKEHQIMNPPNEWMYYNIIFFEEEGKLFFTVWFFVVFPSYISSSNNSDTLNYYLDYINGRKVIFITINVESNDYFLPTDKSKLNAKIEKEKAVSPGSYDGDWYFQTYLISKINGNTVLFETDSANTFFCPDLNGKTKVKSAGKDRKVFY